MLEFIEFQAQGQQGPADLATRILNPNHSFHASTIQFIVWLFTEGYGQAAREIIALIGHNPFLR